MQSRGDADFKALVATLLRNLPLRGTSVLDTAAMQTVIRSTRGNTARVLQGHAVLPFGAPILAADLVLTSLLLLLGWEMF